MYTIGDTTMGRYRKPFTLYKRGKYWYYKTYDIDGYRTCGKSTGQTHKKLAEEYCLELLRLNQLGFSRITLSDYSSHFFDDNSPFVTDRITPLSHSSLRQHRQYLRLHILPAFGSRSLQEITYSDLKSFRQKLLKDGFKANTINGIFQTFNAIMKYAYLDNKIIKNPLQGFGSLPRPNNKDAFRRDEILYLCQSAPHEIRDFIILLSLTGMRMSECYGVTQDNIKNENGVLYIELKEQLTDIGYYTPLKTKERRIIPIADELVPLIHAQTCNHAKIKYLMKPIIRSIDTWEERKLSLHSIRHFFVTDTKAKGINPIFIESIAGHSLRGIAAVYTNFHATDLQSIRDWQRILYQDIIDNTEK